MSDSRDEVLTELLAQAVLAAPADVVRLTGRGFTDEVSAVRLVDGGRVILRRWSEPRPLEFPRAEFLADHDVPAPRLLAATARGSLVEFVDGALLGDLIESNRDDQSAWRATGAAYRRVHRIGFPPRLTGRLNPDGLQLRPTDPVADLHAQLDNATAGLRQNCPAAIGHLAALHDTVDRCAIPLRTAATGLLHGDVNMWNVLVGAQRAVPIDWDLPEIGDPAKEIALLDKHAHLFNGHGLPTAFFEGYGASTEPNTTLHRIVQTLHWVASDDWIEFATAPDLPVELRTRAAGWLDTLRRYLHHLPEHLHRLTTRERV